MNIWFFFIFTDLKKMKGLAHLGMEICFCKQKFVYKKAFTKRN